MKVYKAIGEVSKAMAHEGIAKGRNNTQQGYKFRGIDDVLNALSIALVDAGLVILPRCVERVTVERQTKSGSAIFYVTCKMEFDLVSTEDGSKHTVATYGEAMDSADKATNKAMSAAYKYLALLTFCIPTEATPETDADYTTHDVQAKQAPRAHERAKWLADWLAAIDSAGTVGDLKRVFEMATVEARTENDDAAEALFVAARDAKAAKAKRPPADEKNAAWVAGAPAGH